MTLNAECPSMRHACRKCGSRRTQIVKSESRALTSARCEACGYVSVLGGWWGARSGMQQAVAERLRELSDQMTRAAAEEIIAAFVRE